VAWRKPKPNGTFGIVAVIGAQALLICGAVVAFRESQQEQPLPWIFVKVPPADSVPVAPVDVCDWDCGGEGPPVREEWPRSPTLDSRSGIPEYPSSEVRLGHEGRVLVDLCIDRRGNVTSAKLDTSSGFPALDEAALDWSRRSHWRPATIEGRPIEVCFAQSFFFRLKNRQ
jgi:TonB family protein